MGAANLAYTVWFINLIVALMLLQHFSAEGVTIFHRSSRDVSESDCPEDPATLQRQRNDRNCRPLETKFCYRKDNTKCCMHESTCNPHPEVLVSRKEAKAALCAPVRCVYPGEVCELTSANLPRCRCPMSCPGPASWSRVCCSDGLTYMNGCLLNRTACILGLKLTVKHPGPCLPRSQKLEVSSSHKSSVTLNVDKPAKITCSFEGEPISITWSKIEMDSLPPQMVPDKNTLSIPNVRLSDEGVYLCEAYDGFNVAEASINVTVQFNGDGAGEITKRLPRAACMLPRRHGYCRQEEVRWYFDSVTLTCQHFVFSGCGRNENNFQSEKTCQYACGRWAGNICTLPKQPGPCSAYIPRWYFSTKTKRCERFVYGGCRGNANRFKSYRACETRCKAQSPDITPCIKQYNQAMSRRRSSTFIPSCTDDGRYEMRQCHGSFCFCVDEDGVEEPGTRVPGRMKTNCSEKLAERVSSMPCEKERSEKRNRQVLLEHTPQCKKTGMYEEIQCSPWTGYCWCVDGNGTEMMGTKTRKPLSCPTLGGQLTKCQRQYVENSKLRLRSGRTVLRCANDGSFREMQCRGMSCMCVNRDTGVVIPDTVINISEGYPQCETAGGLTECQKKHRQALRDGSTYIPQCKMNGEYQDVQCDKTRKDCWCVDGMGKELSGTKTSDNIVCPARGAVLTPCQRRYQHSLKRRYSPMNQRAPRCKSDGEYEEVQCHGRECHCVNKRGKQVPGTRVHALGRKPNCVNTDLSVTPCEKAQRLSRSTDSFVPQCKPDGSWQEIQCVPGSGECWCVNATGTEIKGSRNKGQPACVAKGRCWTSYVSQLLGPRASRRLPWCTSDGQFNPTQCYGEFCYCVYEDGEEILGTRISVSAGRPQCGNEGRGLSRCQSHYRGAVLSSWSGGYVPRCQMDGRYEEVQCHGEMSECWCVDPNGHEIPNTRSSGPVKCPVFGGHLKPCQKAYLSYARNPSSEGVVPRCRENGDYAPMQCTPMYCYCVSENGTEISGTRYNKRVGIPICGQGGKQPLSLCQRRIMQALKSPQHNHKGYIPTCKPDGSFEEVQCNQVTRECWCVNKHGQDIHGTRTRGLIKCPTAAQTLTPCQQHYQSVLRELLKPVFVPRCDPDGEYESVQCSDGTCFCANAHGVEIYGTRVVNTERPRCRRPVDRDPTLCQRQLQIYRRYEKRNLLEPQCKPDGSFFPVQCHGAQCYCVDGRGVERHGTRKNFISGRPDCERLASRVSLTPCQQLVQEAIQFLSSPPRHVPRCKMDGRFEEIQCSHLTGYCWCVDTEGREKKGTKTKGHIACGLAYSKSACWKEYVKAVKSPRANVFIPWCTAVGTYHHTQLQGSHYFCVNDRGREIPGTSISVKVGKPNCTRLGSPRYISSPCQRKQAKHQYAPLALGSYIPSCKPDGNYDDIQHAMTYGQSWCVDLKGQEIDKLRTAGLIICPPDAPLTRCQHILRSAYTAVSKNGDTPYFIPKCRVDGGFDQIQCHGLTGQCWCGDINGVLIPGSVTRGRSPNCKSFEKMTACQKQRIIALGLTGRPSSARYLPQCKPNGKYEEVQCHGATGLCWCVDERGQEITGTRTWGHARCHISQSGEFPLDLVIMLPPSPSSSVQKFLRRFASSIVSSFDVTRRGTHVSLVISASEVQVPLKFSSLPWGRRSKQRVLDIIRSMDMEGEAGKLDQGLRFLDEKVFVESNRMRRNAKRVLVLVIDKKQNRGKGTKHIPLDQASSGLKSKGVDVFSVGVGSGIDISELMLVSSRAENVFTAESYRSLAKSRSQTAEFISNMTREAGRDEHHCNLVVDVGSCHASIGAWYYDSINGQCLPFKYSGCGGNANNFPTHDKCRRKCAGVFPRCLAESRRRSHLVLGHYTPSCAIRGKYQALQCYTVSGICWCVDKNGAEKPDTRMSDGTPVCNGLEKVTPCLQERRIALGRTGVPTIGRHVPECTPSGEYSPRQRLGNSKFHWCVDQSGYTISRTQRWGDVSCAKRSDKPRSLLPECQQERDRATMGWPVHSQVRFIPTCTSRGKYAHAQCYKGYCWCVDEDGNEQPGTKQRGQVDCQRIESLGACSMERRLVHAMRRRSELPFFLPRCRDDGSYSPLQCHAATGFCWCVDRNGNEIADTRKWGRKDCAGVNETQTACQRRRQECEEQKRPGQFKPTCKADGSYEEVQCDQMDCWCVNRRGYERQGTRSKHRPDCKLLAWLSPCQIQRRNALSIHGIPVVGRYYPECKADGSYESVQCNPSSRVCWCVTSQGEEIPGSRRDPGVRPNCDKNLCRALQNSSSENGIQCLDDGRFSPVQCDDHFCWCVDEYGNSLYNTILLKSSNTSCNGKGITTCHYGHNNAMTMKHAWPFQCRADGSFDTMQCSDALGSQCWCTSRYGRERAKSRTNGKANCESEEEKGNCKLPFERGPCNAILPRWFFNSTAEECDVFLYGGCDGNANNFLSYQRCHATCQGKSLTPCQQTRQEAKFNLGSYVPKCKENGNFESIQCLHGDEECWCVDKDGKELSGTRTGLGIKPECEGSDKIIET